MRRGSCWCCNPYKDYFLLSGRSRGAAFGPRRMVSAESYQNGSNQHHQALRKQARHLENDIDLKLIAFNKVGTGSSSLNSGGAADTSPLLGDHVFESLSLEIEQMLDQLSNINERMAEIPGTGAAVMHVLQRHREILHGYRQEYLKIQANHTTRMEREELLRGSGLGGTTSPSTSGLSRRDMYLKENTHLHNSSSMVNDQISIAMETKEHLTSQRQHMKRFQTRMHDISHRFPLISSLIQRINIRKRRESLILGGVIGVCTILLLLYAFH